MKKKFGKTLIASLISVFAAFACLGGAACSDGSGSGEGGGGSSQLPPAGGEEKELAATKVYMVGDSTMCEYKVNEGGRYLPRFGYGMELGLYLDEKATIVNLAASGRSSWSFPNESASNYAQLNNIAEGDYLIIGFGHNEQKKDVEHYSNANLSYTDDTKFDGRTASFKKILYDKYIKPALDKKATPILCTPIVRLNNKNDYTGSSGHITSTDGVYVGGDYAQAVRDLGEELNLTVIDLTEITKTDCTTLGYEAASNYYSFNGGTWSDGEGSTVVRKDDTIDTTHTNLYGAKMNAYNLACELKESDNPLGKYVKEDIVKPTYEADYEAGINKSYVPSAYEPFNTETTAKSTIWSGITAPWYGTAFGDLGGNPSATNFTVKQNSANSFTVTGNKNNKGKIANGSEGFAALFQQIEYDKDFEITATLTLDKYDGTDQTGFGIMLRDDIYIDLDDKSIKSNYVAAGCYLSGSDVKTIYSRTSSTAITPSGNKATLTQGASFEVSIERKGDVITVKFGAYTEEYENFALSAVDSGYDYICLYSTRNTGVTFSNVTLTTD